MPLIDLEAFIKAPLNTDPYPYVLVPGFIPPAALEEVNRDYPKIAKPGSFPVSETHYGPAFDRLLSQIQSPEMTKAFAEKFQIDLTGRPTMVTVRGRCRASDGQIHTDSETKLITVLIYMNGKWEQDGGRLRLLRSPDNIEDVVAEVPPLEGTLLAFKCVPNAWHGHKSFEGERRVIQLNWVTSQGVVWREQMRHRLSAKLKKLKGWLAGDKAA